jgi:metacaspase-1
MRKTLMIGINAYPDSPLNGCLNDIRLMYKILKDIYGYTDFRVLDDRMATKKKILAGLQWLCMGAKKGDELIVDYSGHGTQVPCTTKTAGFEIDNLDECLVPYDMNWDDPLRDDDINQFISNLTKGVKFLFIADCCFSGTLLKNPLPPKVKNRYIAPPLSSILTGDISLDEELCMISSKNKTRDGKTIQKLPFIVNSTQQGDALLISGCSDKQTSADAYINGRYHGALTFYLAQTLKEANWNITYSDLVTKVNEKLDKEQYDQDPQCEGKEELLNKLFLGGVRK